MHTARCTRRRGHTSGCVFWSGDGLFVHPERRWFEKKLQTNIKEVSFGAVVINRAMAAAAGVLEGTNCCITSFQLYFKSINNNPSLPACVGILSTNYCANWLAVITFPPFSLLPLSAESSGLGACLSRLLGLLNIQSGCRVATPPHEYSTAGGHEAYGITESQKC